MRQMGPAASAVRPVGSGTKRRSVVLVLTIPLLACCALGAWLLRLPGREMEIASFATGLEGRTRSQTHNVSLALAALNNEVIAPGEEFSFNKTVGPWTADRGYRKAPVSYSGQRVLDWGGGVCQASTTLYNAALLAGFEVRERNRHHWPAHYSPPGQDAAVAYPNIDLRFRNTLDYPVRIEARVEGESVVVRLCSRARAPNVYLEREILAVKPPATVTGPRSASATQRSVIGHPGYDVAVYRVYLDRGPARELVSRDSYPAQNRLVWE